MKKTLLHNINYKGISALESVLLEKIAKSKLAVFEVKDIRRLTGFSKTRANNLLASLIRKKHAGRLFRNKYFSLSKLPENKFIIATTVFAPAYVSFWTALSIYGFTEQQTNTVQIASTKQFAKIQTLELNIQPVKIQARLFFGYGLEHGFPMALKEKALIDAGLNFEHSGGFNEWAKCFKNAWPALNKTLLFSFLSRINNKSLNSRIGYLIEELQLKAGAKLLKSLEQNASKGFIKLDPAKEKTKKYSKKWKIIINTVVKESDIL
ncbi:hypothetical protein HZB88_04775 [archaeon]|nr:hypothetical protein [archaeon]